VKRGQPSDEARVIKGMAHKGKGRRRVAGAPPLGRPLNYRLAVVVAIGGVDWPRSSPARNFVV
jgi:hypothetical protein